MHLSMLSLLGSGEEVGQGGDLNSDQFFFNSTNDQKPLPRADL